MEVGPDEETVRAVWGAVGVTTPQAEEFTQLLGRAANGDSDAVSKLFPLVYEELRRLAAMYFAAESDAKTLQPTAVVHEAFLRLVGAQDTTWEGRAHFFRAASLAMRRVLITHARDRRRQKRGGGRARVQLTDAAAISDDESEEGIDLLALDEALTLLGEAAPRKEQVVQMRYFGGLSVEETAAALGISPAQVKRDWTTARAFLLSHIGAPPDGR